jgi:O-antigen/teichoic acid export membrane protein
MSQANALLNHSIRLLVFTTTSGALIALLFGDTIITILFSERYLESVPAFILLMFGLSFTFMDYTMGYSLVAVGDSAKPAMINLVHIMVTLLSNVALIPVLGISGAALASIAGFVAVNPLYAWFLRRRHVVVPVISHLKPVFLFGSMWLLLFLTGFTLDVVYRIVLIIGFLGACLWLSVISRADIMLAIHEAGSILNSRFLRPRSSETQT